MIVVMRFARQIAVTLMLLLVGATGADCMAQTARMSDAERVCCQHMAGQCDMDSAAQHPCCRKVGRHRPEAVLVSTHRLEPAMLQAMAAAVPALGFELPWAPRLRDGSLIGRRHAPPRRSAEILRI